MMSDETVMQWSLLPTAPERFPPARVELTPETPEESLLTFTGTGSGTQVSMEGMPLYTPYFRRYGVLRAVQLAVPRINSLDTLELPKETILHYMPEDETELGLSQTAPILHNNTRVVFTEHQLVLGDQLGHPRKLPLPAMSMIRDYHRQNRRTRNLLRPETAMRDVNTIVVENYAILSHLYRYPTNYFRGYYKWWNLQATLWENAGRLGREYPRRNQFLQCRLPTLLPTLAQLRRGENGMTRNLLSAFTQPESLFILEIWKWLGLKRETSVFSKASPEDLAQMNLIFIEKDRWLVLNLGLLDKWRKRPEPEAGWEDHAGILDTLILQKRFLRLLMTLLEVRTVVDSEEAADVPVEDDGSERPESSSSTKTEIAPPAATIDTVAKQTPTPTQPDSVQPESTVVVTAKAEPVKLTIPTENGKTTKVKLTANLNLDKLPDALVEETPENIRLIDQAITKDLEALDHLMAKYETEVSEGQEVVPATSVGGDVSTMLKYEPEERSLQSSVMHRVDQQADAGLISGAEYRRMQALSAAFQRLPNPFGQGVLSDMTVIQPEELTLATEKIAPDMRLVPDKTMLKSVVDEFDTKYLDKVYRKDLVRMVLGLQHAGIAVTGFSMDEYQDALNHYEKYTLQLTPVVGKVSTVYFKLPKIEDDGTYSDNGSKYRLRKQRIDVPLRKLSPSRVALTSYYGKVFVNRSEKQANNYAGWLTNQVAATAIDDSNDRITQALLADVSDSELKVPRLYAIMSSRFRSFRVSYDKAQYDFFFDYHARESYFGKDKVQAVEKNGLVVVGRKNGQLLVMDDADSLYEVQGLELINTGTTLEEILGIVGKAPVEMAEIRIFGKQIPVGLFLAYELGLTELFRLMGVKPRRVPTGNRSYVNDDELVLRFEDELWIFPRDRSARTMILSGLTAFESVTRNYSSHLFDRKDIYFNVLEQARIGVRYLREMDLMRDLFIDPITEDILKEMGEPIDFIALTIRACQLLESDWSPAETDMAYMRIKGYERMAGAVYSELVKAVRLQRARGSAANAPIDLHPDAVWIGIQLDPVKKAVEESNPVHNVREREEVTYSGVGGRSSRSMVGRTRVFHPNDMGVISESTKDSADVAITTFMPANPTLTSVRGIARRFDPKKDGITSVMSTPALLAPGADRDDPKRV